MSDDLEFIVIDDIPEYIFFIGDDEENEQVIALSGKDGAFKYEKVDELPTTGEDGVLYLVPKSYTMQTASGNPINVNITDNAGKIESLKLDGDTYQQSYTGKNLFNKDATIEHAFLDASGNWIGGQAESYINNRDVAVSGGEKITISFTQRTGSAYVRLGQWDSGGTFISRTLVSTSPITITLDSTTRKIAWSVDAGEGYRIFTDLQIEQSDSATAYEPFVGGQPSPSPSYPQQIQTVTGTQTVSINGTDYTIDLGSIELCKLGTYQDYIYKDGSDWKIHKATGKTLLGDYTYSSYSNTIYFIPNASTALGINTTTDTQLFSESFVGSRDSSVINRMFYGSANNRFNIYPDATFMETYNTTTKFENWLKSNSIHLFFVLATATDTTITDTNLIAQLEAIRTAALESGSNTISNTATGTNLAGDLEIGYYGYDPLNKYDKYFWLDVDGAYESL